MAGEKMKKSAGVCPDCCGMCKSCATISGVFVVFSGAAFLGFGLGNLDAMTAHLIGGGLLLLYGLGLFVHALKLCPMCK